MFDYVQSELLSSDFFRQPVKDGVKMGQKKYISYRAKSVSGPAVYYMGIVDFLQSWNTKKKIERSMKIHVFRHDKQGISVMEPLPYRDRFQQKMQQIFDTEDPFGLFVERGEARSRSNVDNHSDADSGAVVNALHSAASKSFLSKESSLADIADEEF